MVRNDNAVLLVFCHEKMEKWDPYNNKIYKIMLRPIVPSLGLPYNMPTAYSMLVGLLPTIVGSRATIKYCREVTCMCIQV